jgi:hypothetical protein
MKIILVLFAVIAVCAAIRTSHKFTPPEKQLQDQFVQFVHDHNKQYDQTEFNKRYAIFKENVAKINQMNRAQSDAVFGINKFADLTAEEFAKMYKGYKKTNVTVRAGVYAPSTVPTAPPTSFDWRTQGVVSAVKNQEQCGSCWAFSATEGVESAWKLAGHTLDILAPQQIVDCDTSDAGCDGGDLPTAFAYVHREGLERETNYPYRGVDESCRYTLPMLMPKSLDSNMPPPPKTRLRCKLHPLPMDLCPSASMLPPGKHTSLESSPATADNLWTTVCRLLDGTPLPLVLTTGSSETAGELTGELTVTSMLPETRTCAVLLMRPPML